MKIKLTDAERLILINQFEILKQLKPKEADRYEELLQIVERGYEIFYSELTVGLCEPMASDTADEVIDILNMYRAINDSLAGDKHRNHWARFRGFDGNEESSQFGFASFMITTQRKWQELAAGTPDLNSHASVLQKYRAMLKEWRRLAKPYDTLTREQIDRIVVAGDRAE